jgi:hypothetical protein
MKSHNLKWVILVHITNYQYFWEVCHFGYRASFSCCDTNESLTSQARKRGPIAKVTQFLEACILILPMLEITHSKIIYCKCFIVNLLAGSFWTSGTERYFNLGGAKIYEGHPQT